MVLVQRRERPSHPVRCPDLHHGQFPAPYAIEAKTHRLRPPASPFGPAFIVKDKFTDHEYSRGATT